MPAIAPGKLVVNQQYSVDGEPLTFLGTRMTGKEKLDANPIKFGYAMFGDRWVFVNAQGQEVEYKKGFDVNQKPGLVPAGGGVAVVKTAKIVA
jgi:hypothetical protein